MNDTAAPAEQPGVDDSSRHSTLVAAGILLSRLAGLVREQVTAAMLGVGLASDAFKAALRIPNLLQNLLGEGVLSASFIPVYARLVDGDDEEEAGAVAGAVAGLLAGATAVLVVVGVVLARPLTFVLAPGFSDDPEKFDLTVDLVRIMFPGIGVLVLSAWCLGILNSHRRFFLSYVAPVLWNVAQIVVVVAVAVGGSTQRTLAEGLAWGVVLGGLLQFLVQVPTVRRLVPRLRISVDRSLSGVKDTLGRLGSVILGRGVVQVSSYLDLFIASFLIGGAVAAGTFAQVLYLLPISLFAMSVAAAELPELSRLAKSEPRVLQTRLDTGLRRIAFFVVPTSVLYIAVGETIVGAVYQRGEFGRSETRQVWLVLAAYSLGLLASSAARLAQNALYALDDPRTPARIALVRVVVGVSVSATVMFPLDGFGLVGTSIERTDVESVLHLGAVGIAIGSATAAWTEFLLLRAALRWRVGTLTLGGGALAPLLTAALAAAAAARLVLLVAGDPAPLVAAPLALAPAGIVYLGLTQVLGLGIRDLVRR